MATVHFHGREGTRHRMVPLSTQWKMPDRTLFLLNPFPVLGVQTTDLSSPLPHVALDTAFLHFPTSSDSPASYLVTPPPRPCRMSVNLTLALWSPSMRPPVGCEGRLLPFAAARFLP